MKIENIKELQKVIQLCRKQGIESFEIGDIKFTLGSLPKEEVLRDVANDFPEASLKVPEFSPTSKPDTIKTDELTPEQLLMWSAVSNEQGA